jgi:hypothetical protein
MHPGRDVDLGAEPTPAQQDAIVDLELDTILAAMAGDDPELRAIAATAMVEGTDDPEVIAYRQAVLADCLEHPAVVRDLREIAVEAMAREKRVFSGFMEGSPERILTRSVQVLEIFLASLTRLRAVADRHGASFRSDGFRRFFATIERELDDAYLGEVAAQLRTLRFGRGHLLSARLGAADRRFDFVLRRSRPRGLLARLGLARRSGHSFTIAPRDESGSRTLARLRSLGVDGVADAAARSADHILRFFAALRAELGFYVGCLNLHDRLEAIGATTCVPVAAGGGSEVLTARGLYDVGLALTTGRPVVGNRLDGDGRRLVMITGANSGGKSTLLRAIGLAQLMMQCGMFVGAEAFSADPREGLFTHYRREEDAAMAGGKLDEELGRMSRIVDAVQPRSMVLLNESFASTNEREGSAIARGIIRALVDAGVKVLMVTHMFDLAEGFHREGEASALFLRAEREPDGRRTFRLREGAPMATSFAADVFEQVFGEPARERAGSAR